jgi:hypothetical protein
MIDYSMEREAANMDRHEIDKVLGTELCACGKCTTCIWRLEHHFQYGLFGYNQ